MKSLTYSFHMKAKILAEFHICISIPLMNDSSKNSGNKNVKSNRFLRADDPAQSNEKLFDLNVERSSKIQFFKNILNMLKNQIF